MAGKTWGPFTGAQLTMMFVSVVLALAVPGSLWAVATSAVSITDPANGHTAAVSSTRRLFVSALNEEAPVPAAFFHAYALSVSSGSGCTPLFTPPTGRAAIVTDVRIDVFADPTPGTSNTLRVYSGHNCETPLAAVNPPTIGHYVIPFGPGAATQTGISVGIVGGVQAEAYADGYFVPASQVPAG